MAGLHVVGGRGPGNVQIKANVGYGRLIPCTKAASVVQSLKNNMQGGLQCRYNNICDVQVEISGKPLTFSFNSFKYKDFLCFLFFLIRYKNGQMKKYHRYGVSILYELKE